MMVLPFPLERINLLQMEKTGDIVIPKESRKILTVNTGQAVLTQMSHILKEQVGVNRRGRTKG